MTLEDIEQQLPKGFHDASLESLEFDVKNLTLKLKFEFLIRYDGASAKTILRLGECLIKNISFFMTSPYISFVPDKRNPCPGLKWDLTVFNLKKGVPDNFKIKESLLNKSNSTSSFFVGDGKTFFDMIVSYETVEFKWHSAERSI